MSSGKRSIPRARRSPRSCNSPRVRVKQVVTCIRIPHGCVGLRRVRHPCKPLARCPAASLVLSWCGIWDACGGHAGVYAVTARSRSLSSIVATSGCACFRVTGNCWMRYGTVRHRPEAPPHSPRSIWRKRAHGCWTTFSNAWGKPALKTASPRFTSWCPRLVMNVRNKPREAG